MTAAPGISSSAPVHDVVVIGGGINGCGIARELSGRGASVFLCEKGDLAASTSSSSTKLIHGGLRYLEHGAFHLVREALAERETLWRMAPHLISPLRFVLPHEPALRPAWQLRAGLFLYDHLGGRRLLPPSSRIDLRGTAIGDALRPGRFRQGFEYSDCRVDDARLVVLNARDACDRGATIRTRTQAMRLHADDQGWLVETLHLDTGVREIVKARVVVNAAGPWVLDLLRRANDAARPRHSRLRLVQGTHIVVPRLYGHDRCYVFQNPDRRIVFAIPYEEDFTLIGTTDRDFHGDAAEVRPHPEDVDYLCTAVNRYLAAPIGRADVVWSYAGVRPLVDDGQGSAQSATREYQLELEQFDGRAILSVFGGKVTTYRRLALHAVRKLEPMLPGLRRTAGAWRSDTPLPGGDFPVRDLPRLTAQLSRAYEWLAPQICRRLCRSYGTRAWSILGDARSTEDLGEDFGAGLYMAEIRHLVEQEWARTAEDIAWRRSKLGLRLSRLQLDVIDQRLAGLELAGAEARR